MDAKYVGEGDWACMGCGEIYSHHEDAESCCGGLDEDFAVDRCGDGSIQTDDLHRVSEFLE